MTPSLLSKVAQFARSPQGRRLAGQAVARRPRSEDPPPDRAGPLAAGQAARALAAQRDAEQLLELGDRLLGLDVVDRRHPQRPRRLEVAGQVVHEDAVLAQPDRSAPSS